MKAADIPDVKFLQSVVDKMGAKIHRIQPGYYEMAEGATK